jgi:hypothetical protein
MSDFELVGGLSLEDLLPQDDRANYSPAPKRTNPVRKKLPKLTREEEEKMIQEAIATRGVTKCPPRYALGSVKMTALGFE